MEAEGLRHAVWQTQGHGQHYRLQHERLLRSPLLHFLTEREERARAAKLDKEFWPALP